MKRGDRAQWALTFTDPAGGVLNLAGKTVWLTVKKSPPAASAADADDASALVKAYWVSGGGSSLLSSATPASGVMTLDIPSSVSTTFAPDPYQYDVQILFGADDVRTYDSGTFQVTADITRRITVP